MPGELFVPICAFLSDRELSLDISRVSKSWNKAYDYDYEYDSPAHHYHFHYQHAHHHIISPYNGMNGMYEYSSSHDAIWKNKFIEEFVYETDATIAKQKAEEKVLLGMQATSTIWRIYVLMIILCLY